MNSIMDKHRLSTIKSISDKVYYWLCMDLRQVPNLSSDENYIIKRTFIYYKKALN